MADYPFSGEVLCAPDSFKGTLTAEEAAWAIAEGVRRVWKDAPIRLLPLADGGEGSLDVLHRAVEGTLCSVWVEGPLGAPVDASYLLLPDGTAVVEMAQASGLMLVDSDQRRPELASTFGTGQLIQAAVRAGAKRVIVCLGGSATTDGGAGMAEALGFQLLDAKGEYLARGGADLTRLARIDDSAVDPVVRAVEVIAATDVTNLLYGPLGAAVVFGPQKGACPEIVRLLDQGLKRLSEVLSHYAGVDIGAVKGGGAAGGLGAGLVGFMGARIESGAEVLMDA